MILIVSPEADLHSTVVKHRIEQLGQQCIIWNATWFPWREKVTWKSSGQVLFSGKHSFTLEESDVVWWRRYRHPTPDPSISDKNVRQFCASEARHLLMSIFIDHPRILNHPISERRASFKLSQLRSARKIGLNIPETIVSNCNEAIKDMFRKKNRLVGKTLYCDYPHSLPARECSVEEFENANEVALAPVIIQELVECIADIRVFVVGTTVFAAELVRPEMNCAIDWRMTAGGWRKHMLPESEEKKIILFMRSLDLEMCSIDMRLGCDGIYYFLEVNPSGQFLFLEVDAGLCVTEALARYLAHKQI